MLTKIFPQSVRLLWLNWNIRALIGAVGSDEMEIFFGTVQ